MTMSDILSSIIKDKCSAIVLALIGTFTPLVFDQNLEEFAMILSRLYEYAVFYELHRVGHSLQLLSEIHGIVFTATAALCVLVFLKICNMMFKTCNMKNG